MSNNSQNSQNPEKFKDGPNAEFTKLIAIPVLTEEDLKKRFGLGKERTPDSPDQFSKQ